MAKRYAIWDKKTDIVTPIFEIFTPAQWMERYPIAKLPNITVICAAGEINGGFFGTMGQMVQLYEGMGADFSACTTDEERLAVIEAHEDLMNTPSDEATPEEIAAGAAVVSALASLPDNPQTEAE